MNYKEAREQRIWNVRLDFDPVGVKFVFDENEIVRLPVSHRAKTRLTFCQFLVAVRQQRYALPMKPKNCLCENAEPAFGFRELEKEADTKRHLKYLVDPEVAWRAPQEKARLKVGTYYMGSRKLPNLTFFHTPNSAVCSGCVWAYNNNIANMTTMCAGSKTSGKTEMTYVNLFIPGKHLFSLLKQQAQRYEKGGPSVLGKGFLPWPGLDVCKSCPLFRFEKISSGQAQ